jgi:threonyl-tRNA synthetase
MKMPKITLPDNSERHFNEPLSVFDLAKAIGAGLAKAAIAAKIDGKLVDTSTLIDNDVALSIITKDSEEGVEVLRHSTAHLLAQAVKRLFPSTQVTIGPVIDEGFYYDFSYERPFTPEDLVAIEKEMAAIVKANLPVVRQVMTREQAIIHFEKIGEHYKVEIIKDLPPGETISVYQQGEFLDLCRGPHVPSTAHLKVFQLMRVAGAYWRGDSNNEMLQRIYGTAFADKEALQAYLHRLEEAEKRDHRKIGKRLDLFHLQAQAPGMVFWHDKGWMIYQTIVQYIRTRLQREGYQEVNTPVVMHKNLWEKSGHWEVFRENMFITESEKHEFAVKPMNCPAHIQIFNQHLHSYRDLPLRLAEFGSCHRNEASGALHGIMRVRGFVQDDAHIFCTEAQIQSEAAAFIKLLLSVYEDFGFNEVIVKLSTRPEKRVGSDETWDRAEKALADALNTSGLSWEELPGEGAFYGPKIEFSLKDCIGRVWQCGTFQIDYSMPNRLEATYVDEAGERQVPVMLHRAVLGSLERFIGILIEHYAGLLPPWLAPIQAVFMSITDAQHDFIKEIQEKFQNLGFRVKTDLRNEKIGYKIREHTIMRIPYLLVVGDRELQTRTLSVRTVDGQDLGAMALEEFESLLKQAVEKRGRIADS